MKNSKLSKLMGRLFSVGVVLLSTAILVLAVEAALSTWVYRDKGYVEPAFCEGGLAYTASCTDPHPLFHLRIAALAIYNAITLKSSYEPRPFSKLSMEELESLDQWRDRGSRKDRLPWNPSAFADYTYDSFGRRVAGSDTDSHKKPGFLAFFGGSWVHGDWLPYHQTLPGLMEKRMPAYRVYNYGIQGGGLQELFLGAQKPSLIRDIPEKNGVYVYVYKWMHLDRLRPSVSYIAGRFNSFMADYTDGKELGFGGSFYEAFPVLTPLLAFAHHSGISKLTGLNRKMIPQWELQRLYCDMLVQTKNRLESVNGAAKFVVLIYGRNNPAESRQPPIRCLEQNGIPFLAPFFDGKLKETYLPDGHPDGDTHRKVAEKLSIWLHQLGYR